MLKYKKNINKLILGTAKWGSIISRSGAFKLLDRWIESDQVKIDSATNYPLDSDPAHFRLSEDILAEYIRLTGLTTLDITMKIGSICNVKIPNNDLSPEYIHRQIDHYLKILGPNLKTIMIHWDNRSNPDDISSTIDAIRSYPEIKLGLSGIKHPEIYRGLLGDDSIDIQVKYDLVESILEIFPNATIYTYGIDRSDYLRSLDRMRRDDRLSGVLVGPRTIEQLNLLMALTS